MHANKPKMAEKWEQEEKKAKKRKKRKKFVRLDPKNGKVFDRMLVAKLIDAHSTRDKKGVVWWIC